mgnify:CR=1 FL=1
MSNVSSPTLTRNSTSWGRHSGNVMLMHKVQASWRTVAACSACCKAGLGGGLMELEFGWPWNRQLLTEDNWNNYLIMGEEWGRREFWYENKANSMNLVYKPVTGKVHSNRVGTQWHLNNIRIEVGKDLGASSMVGTLIFVLWFLIVGNIALASIIV